MVVTATQYYISPTGSDSNPGTSPTAPWQTTAPANKLSHLPGDAIFFEATKHSLQYGLQVSNANGVKVSAYGGIGPATLLVDSSISFGVQFVDSSNVEISNLNVINSGNTRKFNGIHLLSQSKTQQLLPNHHIHDIYVQGFYNGIEIEATGCFGFSNVLVERVNATGSSISGIGSNGADSGTCYSHYNITVSECIAYENPGDPTMTNNWSGSGICLSAVNTSLITHSIAYRNGMKNGHQGGGPVGIWFWETFNGKISHCVSFENDNGKPPLTSNDGGGFDLDGGCESCVIEYSLSYNNTGPGYLICSFGGDSVTKNNIIRYSVSYADGTRASNGGSAVNFYTPDSLNGNYFYGNTFVQVLSDIPLISVIPYGPPPNDVQFHNNAFLSLSGSPFLSFPTAQMPPQSLFNSNEYWFSQGQFKIEWGNKEFNSLSAWKTATGNEANGTDINPNISYGDFFHNCVPSISPEIMPKIPNSNVLNNIRGFSGC
jgi:hypothetical protein